MANATVLALEELQNSGGLLGRPLQVVYGKPEASPKSFASEAERLIVEEKVEVVFGCWSSASRKSVVPIVERHRNLLFYPLQYEGLERSPNVIYTGEIPNQQLVPAVKWSRDNLGKRFFLVGSDYIYPRIANRIASEYIESLQGEVVGEEYLLLGSAEVSSIIEKIRESQPDVIINTVNGSSNFAFYQALQGAGVKIPTVSTSMAEADFQELGASMPIGHYAVWSYFQSVESTENRQFVSRYRARFGQMEMVTAPMEAAYIGVHLWAQAVKDAGSSSPEAARLTIGSQSMAAPEGIVSIDPITHHTWKSVRVGQLGEDGQFKVLWSSAGPVKPRPFPDSRSPAEWAELLDSWYKTWNDNWMNVPTS